MASHGSIYKLYCKTSGLSYIGQTQDTKQKDDKAYKYGVSGRWADHVSSAFRGSSTPLAKAIVEFGADDFVVSTLETRISESNLDEREAHWIKSENTCVPLGYNVMKHSRCKHRTDTSLADHYLPTTKKVRITSVKSKGVYKIVYVYLDQEKEEPVRLVFGQGADATYESALEEAREFVLPFAENGIEIFEENADDPLCKYEEKIEQFRGADLKKIRIAKFNSLVALHIKKADGPARICFGGKTVAFNDAYLTAIAVKNRIMEMHPKVPFEDDILRSATGGCL